MTSSDIGETIKEAVKKSGMTQNEVANKAKISKNHLHKIKTGLIDPPSIKLLARIGHVVGKKLSDLKKK